MKFEMILKDTVSCGESTMSCVDNILACEAYCAQTAIYREYLRQNQEKAELYKQTFRSINDKIYSQAINLLDAAIDMANVELAESAMATVNAMHNAYPKFYKAYYKQLFGR